MMVLVVENVSPSVRGEISRWLIEPRAGVFVGNLSARVRDKLWERVTKRIPDEQEDDAGAIMIYSARTEQGFAIRCHGEPRRKVIDAEGLTLVKFCGV